MGNGKENFYSTDMLTKPVEIHAYIARKLRTDNIDWASSRFISLATSDTEESNPLTTCTVWCSVLTASDPALFLHTFFFFFLCGEGVTNIPTHACHQKLWSTINA